MKISCLQRHHPDRLRVVLAAAAAAVGDDLVVLPPGVQQEERGGFSKLVERQTSTESLLHENSKIGTETLC